MEKKEKSCAEGSSPKSPLLRSNSVDSSINSENGTSTDDGSSCDSKKQKCKDTEEEEDPRKKIKLVDPKPTSPTTSNAPAVKPTTVSPLKHPVCKFSFQWFPPFRQSESSCGSDSPAQKVFDFGRMGSVPDSSPDILKRPSKFIKPAPTHPLFLFDSVAAPIPSTVSQKSKETIRTVTKHPFSPSPSSEIISRWKDGLMVFWSKEEETEVEVDCVVCKKKTMVVVSKGDKKSPKCVQIKCNCGRFCGIVIFH